MAMELLGYMWTKGERIEPYVMISKGCLRKVSHTVRLRVIMIPANSLPLADLLVCSLEASKHTPQSYNNPHSLS